MSDFVVTYKNILNSIVSKAVQDSWYWLNLVLGSNLVLELLKSLRSWTALICMCMWI